MMEPPPPMDRENIPIDAVKEKRKRRSSILKKRRSSSSPPRSPLGERGKDGFESPSRKKRNLGENRRVSFSKAPEVREFTRDPKPEFPPLISPNPPQIAGIDSLMFGSLLSNPASKVADSGLLDSTALPGDKTIIGNVDMSLTCVAPRPANLLPDLPLDIPQVGDDDEDDDDGDGDSIDDESHGDDHDDDRVVVTASIFDSGDNDDDDHCGDCDGSDDDDDDDVTPLDGGSHDLGDPPHGATVVKPPAMTIADIQDMSMTCVADGNLHMPADDMEMTHIAGDGDGFDMEMTCRDMDATCRQIDNADSSLSGSSSDTKVNVDYIMGFIQSLPKKSGEGGQQATVPLLPTQEQQQLPPLCDASATVDEVEEPSRRPIAAGNATMTCLEHFDMSEDESCLGPEKQQDQREQDAHHDTGASQCLDQMSLNDAGNMSAAPLTSRTTAAAPPVSQTFGNEKCPTATSDMVAAVATPPFKPSAPGQAFSVAGPDETYLTGLGQAASTPVAGGMVALQPLEETIISMTPSSKTKSPKATAKVKGEPRVSVVVPATVMEESQVNALPAEVATFAASNAATMPAESIVPEPVQDVPSVMNMEQQQHHHHEEHGYGIEDEQPPSFLDGSEAATVTQLHTATTPVQAQPALTTSSPEPDLAPVPPVPMANLVDCVTACAQATTVSCEFPDDLMPMVPYEEWTPSQKLLCTFVGQPFRELLDYGFKEITDVNCKLSERLTPALDSSRAAGLEMPQDVAEAHACNIVSVAEVEPCGFQTRLLTRFSEQLLTGQQQLDGLLNSLSEQCGQIDEAFQLLDIASNEVQDACQRLRTCQLTEDEMKVQGTLIVEVQEKHSELTTARGELERCEADRSRLVNEKDQLQQQIAGKEATLAELVDKERTFLDNKQATQAEFLEAKSRLNLAQSLQEWTLVENSRTQAVFSFLCNSVRLTLGLEPPQTTDGGATVLSVDFDEQPAETKYVWEKQWTDFAAVLFLDGVEDAQDQVVKCRTVQDVLDLLAPMATASRLLAEECWSVSLYHTVTQDAPERSICVQFSGTKPLHRFVATFHLPHRTTDTPELFDVVHDFGNIRPEEVRQCIAKVPAGNQWLCRAVNNIRGLCNDTPMVL